MFVDKVRIRVKAGDGGNGCVSFRREKYIERGGPDGGDGGKGGDVVLVADKNVGDLSEYFFHPRVVAKHGGHGRGKNCFGRKAADVVAKVPVGTQVFALGGPIRELAESKYHPAAATEEFSPDTRVGMPFGIKRRPVVGTGDVVGRVPSRGVGSETGAAAEGSGLTTDRELIADLTEDGQRYVLARGGRGGRGNAAFKSSIHQAPREFEYGEPGEQWDVELELKTLADVGIVGFPNAGKSTLISKITKAHPKIAPYPFTTLTPNVGIIGYDDFTRIRVADIPGLIEGAHRGKGLGHDFLRHIERCGLLVLLIDMAGVDGRNPWDDYEQLLRELELYQPGVLKKPRLVVANKMDLPDAKKNLAAFKRNVGHASSLSKCKRPKTSKMLVLQISALDGTGLEKLKVAVRRALQ
jgi:GTP-binding protein